MVSSREGFIYAPLYYRNLQFCLNRARSKTLNWEASAHLSPEALAEISWWEEIDTKNLEPVPLTDPKPTVFIYTDACNSGWGASIEKGTYISGKWTNEGKKFHINWLELKAVHLALKEFLTEIEGKCISVASDNVSAVFYINNMGGHPFS